MEGAWLVAFVALWAIVFLVIVLLLGLVREVGGLHSRVGPPGVLMTEDGLEIGDLAPSFTATEIPSGREMAFQAEGDRNALVVFVSPNCEPCRKLLPALAKGWAKWQRLARIQVVCEGSEEEVRAFADATKAKVPLLADPQARIRAGYGHPPTPFAYLIGAAGTVQLKGIVNLGDDIDRLVVDARARAPGGRELLPPNNEDSADGPGNGPEPGGTNISLTTPMEVSHGQLD